MLDRPLRAVLARPVHAMARALDRRWISPNGLTMTGLALGLAAAVAAGLQVWGAALALWLVSRVVDGLDGALARLRKAEGRAGESEAGGFLDITADFVAYGATVVGVAVGAAAGFAAPWWPFLLVLFAYYINGTAFLAFSSIAERTGRTIDDGRSLSFLGRIAEGTETIVVHSLWFILPFWAAPIAVGWAALVAVSAVQRMVAGYRALR